MAPIIQALDELALLEMPLEGNGWQQWRARIWNQMVRHLHCYPGLAPLEQWMWRSQKEERCIECGAPGTVEQKSVIVAAVDHYYLCTACDTFYRNKHDDH